MQNEQETQNLIELAKDLSRKRFGSSINFYHTGDRFPAVSLTGNACALDCRHCKRKLIERLIPATDPEQLLKTCITLHERGCKGVLLTGGCTRKGKVPVYGFLDAVKEIKQKTGMLVIAHTGITDASEAAMIKEAGIDGVSIDVVGSPETTKEVYGLEITPEDYARTLKAFELSGIGNITPHVCVGLHNGRLFHEERALEIISCIKPTNIVITGLTGLGGTPMQGVKIRPMDVARVVCQARIRFPESYVSLGCARGKGGIREEIDRLCIRVGVNGIAIPTNAAYDEAEKEGLAVKEYDSCCALTAKDLL